MRLRQIITIVIASGGLGCLSFLGGCGADETRTTGSQLDFQQLKASVDEIRGDMKGQRKKGRQAPTEEPKKAPTENPKKAQ